MAAVTAPALLAAGGAGGALRSVVPMVAAVAAARVKTFAVRHRGDGRHISRDWIRPFRHLQYQAQHAGG